MHIGIEINTRTHFVTINVTGELTAENFAFLVDLWALKEKHDDAVAAAIEAKENPEQSG